MNKQLYDIPSSEAFEVSLEENYVQTNVQNPGEGSEQGWDDTQQP